MQKHFTHIDSTMGFLPEATNFQFGNNWSESYALYIITNDDNNNVSCINDM